MAKRKHMLDDRDCSLCGVEFHPRNHSCKTCPDCIKEFPCQICGKITKRTSPRHKYCSDWCTNASKRENYYDGNFYATLKRDNFVCRKCGGDNMVSVHHIDYSGEGLKEYRANNKMDNLISLCNSCHQSLHTHTNRTLVQRHIDEAKQILADFLEAR